MIKELEDLCMEYVISYKIIICLVTMNGLDSERLKLFRVIGDRLNELEYEIFDTLVKNGVGGRK